MVWILMDQDAKDGRTIIRWHKVWKIPMAVRYKSKVLDGMDWIEATYAHAWPEDAFTQHYAEVPEGPEYEDVRPKLQEITLGEIE